MADSSDHNTGKTGLTPTVTVSKNGSSSFGAAASTIGEIANGWYRMYGAGLATDLDTLGPILIHGASAGADPVDMDFTVVAYNPFDSVRMGMTALPNYAIGAKGALPATDLSTGLILTGYGPAPAQANANLIQILGATITGTAAYLVASFTKFFNIQAPTGTVNSLPDAVGGATGGLAILGSKMDLQDAPNATAVTAFRTEMEKSGTQLKALYDLKPAYTPAVDSAGKVAVPDSQKVDVNTVKTRAVADPGAITVYVGNATHALSVGSDGSVTVGGYATNQGPLYLLTGGANTLAVDSSHRAAADLKALEGSTDMADGLWAIIAGTQLLAVNLTQINASSTAGTNVADGFVSMFNVASGSRHLTIASYNQGADGNTILTLLNNVKPAHTPLVDADGKVTYSNAAPPSAADVKTALEAAGGVLEALWGAAIGNSTYTSNVFTVYGFNGTTPVAHGTLAENGQRTGSTRP
jgi:hypothetical protein